MKKSRERSRQPFAGRCPVEFAKQAGNGVQLITTGPYAVVRHPIYTGILTGFLGIAIAISQVRGFIVFVLVFIAFWIKLRMEEQWMRSQFGEVYATYARLTAALVPYLL